MSLVILALFWPSIHIVDPTCVAYIYMCPVDIIYKTSQQYILKVYIASLTEKCTKQIINIQRNKNTVTCWMKIKWWKSKQHENHVITVHVIIKLNSAVILCMIIIWHNIDLYIYSHCLSTLRNLIIENGVYLFHRGVTNLSCMMNTFSPSKSIALYGLLGTLIKGLCITVPCGYVTWFPDT
jgi:hypothetical protein